MELHIGYKTFKGLEMEMMIGYRRPSLHVFDWHNVRKLYHLMMMRTCHTYMSYTHRYVISFSTFCNKNVDVDDLTHQ